MIETSVSALPIDRSCEYRISRGTGWGNDCEALTDFELMNIFGDPFRGPKGNTDCRCSIVIEGNVIDQVIAVEVLRTVYVQKDGHPGSEASPIEPIQLQRSSYL